MASTASIKAIRTISVINQAVVNSGEKLGFLPERTRKTLSGKDNIIR